MVVAQDDGSPLEDHLRNLILNNTENAGEATASNADGARGTRVGNGPQLPQSSAGNRNARKRPNQAQRRQMNAQLSIPVDPRAVAPQPPAAHLPSAWYNNHRPGPNFPQEPPHHPSPGFRGSSQGHLPPNSRSNRQPHQHQHHNHHHHHHQPQYSGGFDPITATSPTRPHYHHHHHPPHQSWRRQEPPQGDLSPRGVNLLPADVFASRAPRNTQGTLYNSGGYRPYIVRPDELAAQTELLENLCSVVIKAAEIEPSEISRKESFRAHIEELCRAVISHHEIDINGASWFQPYSVRLECFGSLASGFATKASDMDLGLLSPLSVIVPEAAESPIPRLVEKALLDAGFGARLLTRTRVPIIKLCENPPEKLRHDLIEERKKWEKGLTEDDHDMIEDDTEMNDKTDKQQTILDAADSAVIKANSPMYLRSQDSEVQAVKSDDKAPLHPFPELRQAYNQSSTSYYATAKKVLRRMNGRDVTPSNAANFEDADFLLLDDVSRAFVDGLHDETLKNRVRSYTSFSAGKHMPNYRTLQGVTNMVEGETLVMLWEAREISESDPRIDQASTKAIHWWKELLDKRSFGVDPLSFNKQLHQAVENIRKIPSIQLITLQQDQFESPTVYHARTVKIMAQLNPPALTLSKPGISTPAIRYYVSGIRDEEIRDEVKKFAISTDTKNIRVVARKHKSLHLAAEYAQAIDKGGLYHADEDIRVIKAYIELLRGDLVQMQAPYQTEYVLPIPESFSTLFSRIRELPDPSRLCSNQPKDRYHDRLEFPQTGVGIQCDINFSAHLGLQNSQLLRCYSFTDPRVRPLVLFVKHWAKARSINTPYRGTLSSYGYVLMVLHYLVNIAQPFVCPNLQLLAPPDPDLPPEALEGISTCRGRNVRFWRDEQEIRRLAQEGVLNQNGESIGSLLRGFFEYYAQTTLMSTIEKRGFDWGRDVLSLRTPGGLLTKQEKDWISARTTMQLQTGAPPTPTEVLMQTNPKSPAEVGPEVHPTANVPSDQPLSPNGPPSAKTRELKEVRHRFLFAIEDPFEHEHNVARTVTHNGIVSIRDEFRRAWRIIKTAGKTAVQEDILENTKHNAESLEKRQFDNLLAEIHRGDIRVE